MTVIVFAYGTTLIGEFALFLAKIRYRQKMLASSHQTTRKTPVTLSPQGSQTS